MEFKINPNNVAEETTSDYNRFEQNDFLITSASDNLFNNPGQSKDKNNVVTHNQYGMRWYLFMVWGVLIYYPISLVSSVITNFKTVDTYKDMMGRYGSSYYTIMFAFMIITIIFECALIFLTIKTRNELLDFKASGVKNLKTCLLAPGIYVVIVFVIYLLVVEKEQSGAIGEFFGVLFNPKYFFKYGVWKIYAYIAAYIAFVVGNIKYFNNRSRFFVN